MAKKKSKSKKDAFEKWKAQTKIERRPNASGTNLVDQSQPVVLVKFPNGKQTLMGRWTTLCLPNRCINAVDASDEDIKQAIWGDEPVM